MINPIDGSRPISTATPVRKKGKTSAASGTSFSKHLEEAEGAQSAQGPSALSAIAGVLDVQEVDDALTGAAKGKLRAEDILDKLEDLRCDLLLGSVSKVKLERLTQIVNEKKADIEDPKLNEILDEIDLRAQVELAKFMRV